MIKYGYVKLGKLPEMILSVFFFFLFPILKIYGLISYIFGAHCKYNYANLNNPEIFRLFKGMVSVREI